MATTVQTVLEYQQPTNAVKPATTRAIISLLIALFCSPLFTGLIFLRILPRTLHIRAPLLPRVMLVILSAPLALIVCAVTLNTIGKDPLRSRARRLAKWALALSITNIVLLIVVPMIVVVVLTWGNNLNASESRADLAIAMIRMDITLPADTQYAHGWNDGGWDGPSRGFLLRMPPQECKKIAQQLRDLPRDTWEVRHAPGIAIFGRQPPSWWNEKEVSRGDALHISGPMSKRNSLDISFLYDKGEIYIWIW